MKKSRRMARSSKTAANGAVALGVITVGFSAGLYTPPADAQIPVGSVYYGQGDSMQICFCDGGDECYFCVS